MSNSSFYSNTGITSADVSSITSAKEAAATSETNAATSATNAATSSTNAATSATNAATSETNASNSAATATTSAANASTSETNASASAATATTQASNAATSATAAAGSASTAGTSATNAASSATNAATSETNAATSATNAATSATSASTSATNAGTSETNAAASASSASGYVTSATTQANNAATSATAAATSETNAASSATAASTSASGASTSASNANTSATNAASSASQAATSAAAAALAADNFDDTYLGSNASDPTTDNDGDALNAGDLHFNTSSNTLKVYNGSAWQDAAIDSSGFVQTTGDTMTGALDVQSTITADGLTVDGKTTTDELDLNAIAATISDTAVDIFVYDTRKDSDGGAWRKRTQGTSWYNETLNTATRGSRKEFPAVAVIVAEANQVTIYDGDDPDLPMWMVFNRDTATPVAADAWWRNASSIVASSVSALNGTVCVSLNGTTSSNCGLAYLDFIHDDAGRYSDVTTNGGYGLTIASVFNGSFSSKFDVVLVDPQANDIAMTVLPNAPIDAATGLPVPTIAVATDGGLSIIKDDGSVIDYVPTTSGWHPNSVSVYDSDRFIMTLDGGAGGYIVPIGSSDVSFSIASASPSGWLHFRYVGNQADVYTLTQTQTSVAKSAVAGSKGTSFIDVDESNYSSSLVAYITSDYNTGWMNGDIKLATLSDTDATNVTGSELVTNGTFEANSDWSDYGSPTTSAQSTEQVKSGTYSWKIVSDATLEGISQEFSTSLSANTYVLTGSFYSSTGYVRLRWRKNDDSGWLYDQNVGDGTANTWQTFSITRTDTTSGTGMGVRLVSNTTTVTMYLDDVSVRLAEEDRSVNGNGLQVFGTVTKSAVATGADLVAYSGFSTSNYLEQPYNSDLDFGTGDFCVMGWFKTSSLSSDEVIFNRSDDGLTGALLEIRTDSAGDKIRVFTGSSGYNGLVNFYSSTITTNTWNLISLVRTGSSISIHINGQLGTSSTSTQDLTNASAKARVGIRYLSGAYSLPLTNGALALWRISATAPSPEQIKKIYEDEKVLFQEGAQATLYGSSDAVTALAYDDSTELLHVGTSAGRSVFQGLRRVDNTTTAVSAAISASNNLVGEQ